jgi:hypothetical protein
MKRERNRERGEGRERRRVEFARKGRKRRGKTKGREERQWERREKEGGEKERGTCRMPLRA